MTPETTRESNPHRQESTATQPLPTLACDCGSRLVLDPSTVDERLVAFDCERDDCDWRQVMPQQAFRERAAATDVDVDALRERGEVAA